MFCAGMESRHICAGDSGGPAVDLISGELVGIVLWGRDLPCSNSGPDVFMNVTSYREWIEKIMNSEKDNPSHSFWTCLEKFLENVL